MRPWHSDVWIDGAAHWFERICEELTSDELLMTHGVKYVPSAHPSMERCTRFFTWRLYSFLSSSLLENIRAAASGLRCVTGSGEGSAIKRLMNAVSNEMTDFSLSSKLLHICGNAH